MRATCSSWKPLAAVATAHPPERAWTTYSDHFRILTLPRVDDRDAAIGRIGRFLAGYRQ